MNPFQHFGTRKVWEVSHRQLLTQFIGHFSGHNNALILEPFIHFGSWIGMGDRDLQRFRVHCLGIFDRFADRFAGLAGETDNEICVNLDAQLVAVFGELQRALRRNPFFDIFQDLFITRFKTNDEQATARIFKVS